MIPHLTRSSLHRCLQRHGISRLSEIDGDKPAKRRFKPYPIGYLHTDIAEVQTAEGKLRLLVAIDRTCQVRLCRAARPSRQDDRRPVPARPGRAPYAIHTVLTDNPVLSDCRRQAVEGGIQFTNHAHHKHAFHHIVHRVCDENGIEHRLTKVRHPWTNGQSLPRRRPGSSG